MASKKNEWSGKPVADFLRSLATDSDKAAAFKADPAAILRREPDLSAAQKKVLKGGCLKEVVGSLIGSETGKASGIAYFMAVGEVTCGHAECLKFQKNAKGK